MRHSLHIYSASMIVDHCGPCGINDGKTAFVICLVDGIMTVPERLTMYRGVQKNTIHSVMWKLFNHVENHVVYLLFFDFIVY